MTQVSTAGAMGSIPGQGTKILHALQHSQKKKKKESHNLLSSLRIILFKCMEFGPGGTRGKECRRHKTCSFDPWVRKNSLKEGMATHSSILPWSSPWTVESGGLPSMGSQATFTHYSLSHMLSHFNHVQLFVIPWTVARQAPLFTKFSRPEYWKWVAVPFSRVSSQPKDRTQVSRITGRYFTM